MLILFSNQIKNNFPKQTIIKVQPKSAKITINLRRTFQLNKGFIKTFTQKLGFRRLNLETDLLKFHQIFNNYKKNSLYTDGKLSKALALELIRNQKSYRSRRLRNKMPVRGQRTHTNAKTRRKRDVK